jgi:predicted ribosomally synthesized peptide with SipW-like signal peptide
MIRRTALAAGAVGAVALALSGTGSFASFTSSISGTNSITSGTFQLKAVPGATSYSAGNGVQEPPMSLSANAEPTTVGQGNTLAYTLSNANPGDTYDYTFSVYDVGTLPGQVDTINYSPGSGGSSSPLLEDMTVEVQEQVNGVWTDIPQTRIAKNNSDTPGTPAAANQSHTYYLFYSYGPAFLQPNSDMASGVSEGSAAFRVQYVFTNTTTNPNEVGGTVENQNNVEGLTASPTITVNGTNTPGP